MKRNRKLDAAICGGALVIFIAGYFLGVQTSRYFPAFVIFCMAYGAAVLAYSMFANASDEPRR